MKGSRQVVIGLASAALGFGLSTLSEHLTALAPAGILLSFAGVWYCARATSHLNVLSRRAAFVTAGLLHGAAVWLVTGSPWLATSAAVPALLAPFPETIVRRMGFRGSLLTFPAALIGFALVLAAWPPSLAWLAAVPARLLSILLCVFAFRGMKRFRAQSRGSWRMALGETVPDFTLKARLGRPDFNLAAQRGRHVLINFTRGDWCPVCQVMMRVLSREAGRLSKHNVMVVVITPSENPEAEAFARALGLDYAVLDDPKSDVARLFGAYDPDAFNGQGAPLPCTFLVGPDQTLVHASRPDDVAAFYDPRQVIDVIERGAAPAVG